MVHRVARRGSFLGGAGDTTGGLHRCDVTGGLMQWVGRSSRYFLLVHYWRVGTVQKGAVAVGLVVAWTNHNR